jgi:hypothetical protein
MPTDISANAVPHRGSTDVTALGRPNTTADDHG